MGSHLVSLHMKGTLLGELFTMSREGLTLGEVVSPGSARPQDMKASELHKTEKHD